MSYFYTPVKRLASLRLHLSQLEGKLRFAIRRGIRKMVFAALFAIDTLEAKIKQLTDIESVKARLVLAIATVTPKAQKMAILNEPTKPELYYRSLNLPDIHGAQSPEQHQFAMQRRYDFVIGSLYRMTVYDPTNPLLVFAPVILNLNYYCNAVYWLENEDYQVRADICNNAITKNYERYPIYSQDIDGYVIKQKVAGKKLSVLHPVQKGYGKRFFFTRKNSSSPWEVWHYVEQVNAVS